MFRRQFLQLALGGGAVALVTACNGTAEQKAASSGAAASPASAPSSGMSASAGGAVQIGLSYIPNIQFAPWYWALDKGLFTHEGVTATLRHHGAQEGLFTALASGQEQFVVAGGDEMLQARSQGLDLVSIATVYQRYPVVAIVPTSSTITSIAELKGHTVGVPGRYGETWFGLLAALRGAGLSASDVTVKAIGYTQQAALATHKVDAVMGFSNNDLVQFQQNHIPVRSLALGASVPLVGISVVTTRAVLTAHRDACRAVARATVSGVKAVAAAPQDAVALSVSHVPGLSAAAAQTQARATLDATIPLLSSTGAVDPTAWSAMATFMKDAGLLTRSVNTSTAIDTGLL